MLRVFVFLDNIWWHVIVVEASSDKGITILDYGLFAFEEDAHCMKDYIVTEYTHTL